jgi:hypothetical protein
MGKVAHHDWATSWDQIHQVNTPLLDHNLKQASKAISTTPVPDKAILLADGHLQISAQSCSDCASTGEEKEAYYGKDNEHADYREKPSQIDANAAVEIWLASAKQIHGAAIDVVSKLLVPGRGGMLVIGRHVCSLLD